MSNIKTKSNFKLKLANSFGSIGYFFCSMQWFWVVLLYFSLIKSFALSTIPNASIDSQPPQPVILDPDTVTAASSGPDIFFIIIATAITILIFAITIYVIVKMPSTISKASKNVVRGAAENATPILLQIQHKKDTKQNHIKLTPMLVLIMKLLLIIIPIGLTFASLFIPEQLVDFNISLIVSFWLLSISLFAFLIQYLLGKVFSLKIQDIK